MGTVEVRCNACGYTSEVKTFEEELAASQREVEEVKHDYLEMRQQRDDLLAQVVELQNKLDAAQPLT